MTLTKEQIIVKILENQAKHEAAEDDFTAEDIEIDTIDMILTYALENDTDKENVAKINAFLESEVDDEGNEDADEMILVYLINASLNNTTVFDLNYLYNTTFWPESFSSKEEFRAYLLEELEG